MSLVKSREAMLKAGKEEREQSLLDRQTQLINEQQKQIQELLSEKQELASVVQEQRQQIAEQADQIVKLNESDLIEKENSELMIENKRLQREAENAKREAQRYYESGQQERKRWSEAVDARNEADKLRRTFEEDAKHTQLQLHAVAVVLLVFWGFLAALSRKPILNSLQEFIGQIQAHSVPYGIAGAVALCLLAFALINQRQGEGRTRKEHYDEAVWATNALFLIVLGAVTGFYEYVPYITYPECLIWLVVAYQSIKMAVKSKYTY